MIEVIAVLSKTAVVNFCKGRQLIAVHPYSCIVIDLPSCS